MTESAVVAKPKSSFFSTLAHGAGQALVWILKFAVKFFFFLIGFALFALRSYMRGCTGR